MNDGYICVGLIVMKCFVAQPAPIDSFCAVYNKVVVAKGDADIQAPPAVKKRILANELIYKQCRRQ